MRAGRGGSGDDKCTLSSAVGSSIIAVQADGELSLPDVGESPSQPVNIRMHVSASLCCFEFTYEFVACINALCEQFWRTRFPDFSLISP